MATLSTLNYGIPYPDDAENVDVAEDIKNAVVRVDDALAGLNDEISTVSGQVSNTIGDSAYDVAVANGYVGTETEWLASLDGDSAYQTWLDAGNTGTEADFLASLVGPDGRSAYQTWLDAGNTGTEADFLASLEGSDGASAYQVWLDAGNTGTEADFLASLVGPDGRSAYQVWLDAGNTGTEADFLAAITGPKGDPGTGVPDGGATGQVVTKTETGTAWADPAAVPTTLDSLTDVDVATATDGQSIVYNAATGTWGAATPSGGSGGGGAGVMTWRGPWDVATSYVYGDVATTAEGIFVALTETTGNTPSVPIDPFDDQFDRPDGPIGPAWQINDGWVIAGGRAKITDPSNTANKRLYRALAADGTATWAGYQEQYNGQNSRIRFCRSDESNYYNYNPGSGAIQRVAAGATTTLGTVSGTNDGAALTVTITKSGGTITVTQQDGMGTHELTVTDPAPLTGIYWGVLHNGYASGFDTTYLGGFTFTPAPAQVWGVVERRWRVSSMDDVNAPAALEGEVLTFNATSGKWEPRVPSLGDITLDSLTDVATGGVTAGQALVYDGTTWAPGTASSGGGGGGSPWTSVFTDAMTTLDTTRWTATGGTWTAGTYGVEQTVTTHNNAQLRSRTKLPTANVAMRATIRFDANSSGRAGLAMGTAGPDSGALGSGIAHAVWSVWLDKANNTVAWDLYGLGGSTAPLGLTLAIDTDYRLMVIRSGYYADVYLDGTLVTTLVFPANSSTSNHIHSRNWVALETRAGRAWFRAVDAWVPALPGATSSSTAQDTGWRKLTNDAGIDAGSIFMRRNGTTVHMMMQGVSPAVDGHTNIATITTGFKPQSFIGANWRNGTVITDDGSAVRVASYYADKMRILNGVGAHLYGGYLTWITSDEWPTVLPGTPA